MGRWINCKNCGHYYHTDLARCPECGKHTISFGRIAGIVALAAVCIGAVVGIILGITDEHPSAPEVEQVSGVIVNRDKLTAQLDKLTNGSSSGADSSEESSSTDISSATVSSKEETSKKPSSSNNSTSSAVSSVKPSSSQASSSEEDKLIITEDPYWEMFATPDKDGAVVYVNLNQRVDIIYPAYMVYLMYGDGEVYLDEEMQEAGFTSAERNANGSATFSIPPDRYIEYCLSQEELCRNVLAQLEKEEEINRLTYTDNFDQIVLEFNYSEATDEDVSGAVSIGYLINRLQLIDLKLKMNCDVYFDYKDSENYVVYSFPELFELVYEETH